MKKWIAMLAAGCLVISALPLAVQADVRIENGDVSDDVYAVQVMLQELGYYPFGLDSEFGALTRAAVLSFQADYGLEQDGIVGDITWGALEEAVGSAPASSSSQGSTQTSAAGSSAYSYTSDLSIGSSGESVAAMQSVLVRLGYMDDIVDGIFGSMTQAAVISFQQANGLYPDGIVGPVTSSALQSASGGSSAASARQDDDAEGQIESGLSQGMTGSDVLALQERLADLGYSIIVDGVYGPQTTQVVAAFQEDNGLEAVGSVGPQTAAALNGSPTPRVSAYDDDEEVYYDGVTLTEEIASYMKDLVARVTDEDMSPSEKLWAVFDYIADRDVYPYMQNRIPYYTGLDWPVVYAQDMMYLGGSYCHGYAALFGYAAVLCGYDNVHWVQNGYHAWVDIDGLVYDPVFRDSSYNTLVYGWTYEEAIANNGSLGAGYDYPGGEGTYEYIRVPQF